MKNTLIHTQQGISAVVSLLPRVVTLYNVITDGQHTTAHNNVSSAFSLSEQRAAKV